MAQRTVRRQATAATIDDFAHVQEDSYDDLSSEINKYKIKEVQTIIAGHVRERFFYEKDVSRKSLENFVEFSLFGHEKKKSRCIDLVVESIIRENRKFNRGQNSKNEINCEVIYIFGTNYETYGSNIFEVPLFKLFKGIDDFECPLFIDINGKVYRNWKEVIDADDWFHCLLIAPKNGTYQTSTIGKIELQNILKFNGHGNLNKIIMRENLKETIDKYSQNQPSENENLREDEVDEVLNEITSCLMKKVETGASPNIEQYLKAEVFVDAHIFSKTVEILELNWHANLMDELKDVDGDDMKRAKNKAKAEIFKLRNDWELNRKFKYFWIGHNDLILLYESDWKTVYGFHYKENLDFEKLLREIFKKKIFDLEITCRNNILTVKFKDNENKIKIFVNGETDNETAIGYMIVPKSLEETRNVIRKPRNRSQNNEVAVMNNAHADSLVPFNHDVRDFMSRAREFQILIATWCEGQYNHRCLKKFDEEILQRFVGISIFGDKNRNPSPENNNTGFTEEELKKINKIVDLIKQKNESFKKSRKDEEKNEIHYGVVQIVGFEYANEKNSFYKTPLFKVFRNKNDDNPILIDEEGHVFETWDHFYDATYLPESLICTPKNGYYNLQSANSLELDFIRTKAYWSTGRKIKLALHIAITAGSLFFAFYTGPLAFGIELAMGVRLSLGCMALTNGYSAAEICLRRPQQAIQLEDGIQSFAMVLNICTDIFAPSAESSMLAVLGMGALSSAGFGLGAYVMYSAGRRSYLTYKESGRIDWKDALSFANAALMCGNFGLKIATAGSLIWKSEQLQKFPLLRGLASKNNKMTLTSNNLSNIVNLPCDNNYGGLIRIFGAFGRNALEFAGENKSLAEFKNDCFEFGNNLVKELLHMSWPILRQYVKQKFNINLGDKSEMIFRHYISKFDIFKIKKWLDEKEILNTIKKRLLDVINNKKNVFNGIKATVSRITEKLLQKISVEKENNIGKYMKAEVFVERAILENITDKIKLSYHSHEFQTIDPDLLKRAYDEAVRDIENELDELDFIEKFRSFYYNDEDLVLLTNDHSCDFYVFQNKSVNSIVREIKNSYYKMKKQENIYTITYYNTNEKLILYFDDSDRNNIVGYVVADNLSEGELNLPVVPCNSLQRLR